MRHPIQREMRRITLLLVALPLASMAHAFDMTQLAKLLNRSQASTVTFVEHQYRQVLKTPLQLSGELIYEPPATFEKRVLQPAPASYRLQGSTLSIESPNRKSQQISTRNQPVLRGLMLGFQAVVSGQLDTLHEYYSVELKGDAGHWQLKLTPTDTQLSRYINRVNISGEQGEPRQFEIIERNGDRSVTDIGH
jgi:outer membrane lipoprotein-sorting protein